MDAYAIHVHWAAHPIELQRILHAVGRALLLHVLHERGRHADIKLGGCPDIRARERRKVLLVLCRHHEQIFALSLND